MRILSDVLVILATAVFLLFLYVVTNPKLEPPSTSVMIGIPVLVVTLFVLGIAARFIKLPKD